MQHVNVEGLKLATGLTEMGLNRLWQENPIVHCRLLKGERSRKRGGGVRAPTEALYMMTK